MDIGDCDVGPSLAPHRDKPAVFPGMAGRILPGRPRERGVLPHPVVERRSGNGHHRRTGFVSLANTDNMVVTSDRVGWPGYPVATTVGSEPGKIPVHDANGAIEGYVPVYDSII